MRPRHAERGALVVDEQAGRHDLDQPRAHKLALGRMRPRPLGVLRAGEAAFDTEHARHREAPDVRIEEADGVAHVRQRGGQVRADRAFAHAAFSRGDGQHACGGRDGRVGCRLLGVAASAHHDFGALLAVHLTPRDLHVTHAGMGADAGLDVAHDLGAKGAAGDRQLDGQAHDAVVVDLDRWHHSELDDVAAGVRSTTPRSSSDLDNGGRGELLGHVLRSTGPRRVNSSRERRRR